MVDYFLPRGTMGACFKQLRRQDSRQAAAEVFTPRLRVDLLHLAVQRHNVGVRQKRRDKHKRHIQYPVGPHGGDDQRTAGKLVEQAFFCKYIGKQNFTLHAAADAVRKAAVHIVVAGAVQHGGHTVCQFLLRFQRTAQMQRDVGDLILIERDACLFADDARKLHGHIVNQRATLAYLTDQRILAEAPVLRAHQQIVGMQRKADEKLWLVQIDVVKVLYGVDELVYKVGAVAADIVRNVVGRDGCIVQHRGTGDEQQRHFILFGCREANVEITGQSLGQLLRKPFILRVQRVHSTGGFRVNATVLYTVYGDGNVQKQIQQ